MNEKPILFNGDMVRAILEGRKTETRRIIKPIHRKACGFNVVFNHDDSFHGILDYDEDETSYDNYSWPYGQVGDRLWVRETWNVLAGYSGGSMQPYLKIPSMKTCHTILVYKSDNDYKTKWRPSIFMPRWASRITLEITEIKVERVQDITEEGAKAEGVTINPALEILANFYKEHGTKYKIMFRDLWNSINKKRGFGWDLNPWVWVVKFRRIDS